MLEPLDLRAVETLVMNLRGEVPTDAPDVEPEDAALALEGLLAHCRALRAELDLARQALEILVDIWEQDFGGHGLPLLAKERIERAAAVLAQGRDEP